MKLTELAESVVRVATRGYGFVTHEDVQDIAAVALLELVASRDPTSERLLVTIARRKALNFIRDRYRELADTMAEPPPDRGPLAFTPTAKRRVPFRREGPDGVIVDITDSDEAKPLGEGPWLTEDDARRWLGIVVETLLDRREHLPKHGPLGPKAKARIRLRKNPTISRGCGDAHK